MNTTAAPGSSHQRPQLTELNRQIVWAHGFGNNEMLQRVGECGAVTTKMLSHGLRSRWPSSWCEVCEASGQQPPVAETVRPWSLLVMSSRCSFIPDKTDFLKFDLFFLYFRLKLCGIICWQNNHTTRSVQQLKAAVINIFIILVFEQLQFQQLDHSIRFFNRFFF